MPGKAYDPFRATQSPLDQDVFPTASDERDEYVPNPDEVPAGSAKEVLEWVGGDKERAARAFEAEQQKSEPRKGLSHDLNVILED